MPVEEVYEGWDLVEWTMLKGVVCCAVSLSITFYFVVCRYNNLLRSEEAEESFWESMKNTNVKKKKTRFDNETDDEVTSEAGASVVAKESLQRQDGGKSGLKGGPATSKKQLGTDKKPSDGGKKTDATSVAKRAGVSGPSEGEGDGNKKKFSSRKFDKHHQKDRSTRKFSV